MKLSVIAALAAQLFSATAFAADTYKLDPVHTSIVFKINHLGFSNVYGVITGAEGKFIIDEAAPEKSSVEISAKTSGLTTFDKKRDEHLAGPDFFNIKQFPTISFKSKTVKKDGNKYAVTGDLTMHGVTKPVSFTFDRFNTGKDPWGKTRTGGETSFTIKRTDFKMAYMAEPGKLGDEVGVTISLEGVKE